MKKKRAMALSRMNDEVTQYDPFEDRAKFEYKYSLIPRRCYSTNKWVWGLAMRGRAVWTGPGDDVVEERWYNRHEAIIKMLKG